MVSDRSLGSCLVACSRQSELDRHGREAEIAISYQRSTRAGGAGEVHPPDTDFDEIGAGCYITAVIVEAHGGTLTEGDETTVRIRFPALSESAW